MSNLGILEFQAQQRQRGRHLFLGDAHGLLLNLPAALRAMRGRAAARTLINWSQVLLSIN